MGFPLPLQAGATVYVTGLSIRGSLTQPDVPGTTIEATAEFVTARGGIGIPVRVDDPVQEYGFEDIDQ